MKRWLVASIGLNLVLAGMFIGFTMTAAMPTLPLLPPGKPMHGMQRDLLNAADVLDADDRKKVVTIINDSFAVWANRPGAGQPPRPGGLIRSFVQGDITPDLPPHVVQFERGRIEEVQIMHKTIYDISQMLDRKQREKFAAALLARFSAMDKCMKAR